MNSITDYHIYGSGGPLCSSMESKFYVHDGQRRQRVHKGEKAAPQPKGEGVSMVVADFVLTDESWLRSPDGGEAARIVFKADRARDGYFYEREHLEASRDSMWRWTF